MKDCSFCKIISGELPCHKIYEDDFVIAFLDQSNDVPGHTVVAPKKHYESFMTCDNSTLAKVVQAAKKVVAHYCDVCAFEGVEIQSNFVKEQKSAKHFCFHLYPRMRNQEFENNDLDAICDKLKFAESPRAEVDDEDCIVLYTDGACSGNPGAGGWASILSYKGKEKVLSGGEKETTNNRMELMAVIVGLESVKANVPVEVYSDSAYVVNAFQQGWVANWENNNWKTAGKGQVQNIQLWQRLLAQTRRLQVHFNKVKGHSDNSQNNRCDALAREEIKKLQD